VLTFAIINGHFNTAVALLEKGANPNIADKSGMTSLYAAVDMNTIQTVWGRRMPLLQDAMDPARMARSLLAAGRGEVAPGPRGGSERATQAPHHRTAHAEHRRCLAQPGHDSPRAGGQER